MRSLSLRSKISLLSALSMGVILIVLYVLITVFYSSNQLKTLDQTLIEDVEVVKGILRFDQQGKLNLYNQPDEASLAYAYKGKIHYLIRDEKQQPVRRSANMTMIELPTPEFNSNQTHFLTNFTFAGKKYRLCNYYYEAAQHSGTQDLTIQIIRSLGDYEQERQALIFAMLQLAPLPIFLVGLGGWWIAGRSLRPINNLIETVNKIDADDLSTRVPVAAQDEVGKLANSFNVFLNRVESAFSSLRRFTADASHELRTPLTSMRIQGEVALSRPREKQDYKDTIGSMLEDIGRLDHLTDSLLQFARSDAGILKVRLVKNNLSALLQRWIENLVPLSEEKSISLESVIDRDIELDIDEVIFERIIINLIENAIQYTPHHGKVSIELTTHQNYVRIKVCDTGPGIPDEAKQSIFNRFVRLDATRHSVRGAGLGLAIVKWAVDLHGGTVTVTDNIPVGACFIVDINRSK